MFNNSALLYVFAAQYLVKSVHSCGFSPVYEAYFALFGVC